MCWILRKDFFSWYGNQENMPQKLKTDLAVYGNLVFLRRNWNIWWAIDKKHFPRFIDNVDTRNWALRGVMTAGMGELSLLSRPARRTSGLRACSRRDAACHRRLLRLSRIAFPGGTPSLPLLFPNANRSAGVTTSSLMKGLINSPTPAAAGAAAAASANFVRAPAAATKDFWCRQRNNDVTMTTRAAATSPVQADALSLATW